MKPRYIACHYRLDLVPPTPEVLVDAYHAARDNSRWLVLPFRALTRARFGRCWDNVRRAVRLWGGKMAVGWSFNHDPLPDFKNSMAGIEAIAHAVWLSPEGSLIEVSRECKGKPFMPSEVVQPMMALNVGFCDTLAQASSYSPAHPVLAVMSGTAACKIPRKATEALSPD
jgi:hypothetical protein